MAKRTEKQFGNYRIIRLLGTGGFAKVYLGEHIHLGTQAAIKVLSGQLTLQDQQGFIEEARKIARLTHPHIVRLLEFGIEGTIPFMVMDYAPHGTLRDRHPIGTRLPLSTIIPYVKQLSEALQYAHDAKLIHRDIKPENMLVGANNQILLSDFGIAVIAKSSRSQSTKDVIGTFEYMSPEQFRGKPLPASDQYSLACVIYEWICGSPVFSGTLFELMTQHVNDQPPSLSVKTSKISHAVEEVILKALSKKPEERFVNIQEFSQALEQANQQHRSKKPAQSPGISPNPQLAPTMPVMARPQGTLLSSYQADASEVTGLLWSSNGEYLVSKSASRSVLIREVIARRKSFSYTFQSSFLRALLGETEIVIAWSSNGNYLALGSSDGIIRIIEAATGNIQNTYRGHLHQVIEVISWSPDDRQILSKDNKGATHVWSVISGDNELTLSGCAILSPEGIRVTSCPNDFTVQVWNVLTRSKIFTHRGHISRISVVSWSPDGVYLATGSDSGNMLIWDTTIGEIIDSLDWPGKIDQMVWSPSGKYLARSGIARRAFQGSHRRDKDIYLIAISDIFKQRKVEVALNLTYPLKCLAWTNDERRIVAWDIKGNVTLWNIAAQGAYYSREPKIIFNYLGQGELSPDSMYIATASNDRTLQVWDATNGTHIYTFIDHPGKITALAWSPDNKRIATGADDGMVRIWQAV